MSIETTVIEAEIATLTLNEFEGVSGWSRQTIIQLVDVGVLVPIGDSEEAWTFEASRLALARRLRRLQEDLEVELDPKALALSYRLLERIQDLEAALAHRASSELKPL
jgi:chaperone modulatory protein CbpM